MHCPQATQAHQFRNRSTAHKPPRAQIQKPKHCPQATVAVDTREHKVLPTSHPRAPCETEAIEPSACHNAQRNSEIHHFQLSPSTCTSINWAILTPAPRYLPDVSLRYPRFSFETNLATANNQQSFRNARRSCITA